MTLRRRAAILGGMWLLVASQVGWASDRPHRPIVPGDAIVTFKPQTEGDRLVRRAPESSADSKTSLDSVAVELGHQVAISLLMKQRLSGDRLLLSIDCTALEELAAAQLRAQPVVAKIDIRPRSSRTCLPSDSPTTLVVEWASNSPDTQANLSETLTVPHSLRRDDHARLIIELDVPALTLALVDRLKHLPDLASAQPNYVMTIR